jgi:hypothetical protein
MSVNTQKHTHSAPAARFLNVAEAEYELETVKLQIGATERHLTQAIIFKNYTDILSFSNELKRNITQTFGLEKEILFHKKYADIMSECDQNIGNAVREMGLARSIGHYHRLFGLKGDVDNHKRLKKSKKAQLLRSRRELTNDLHQVQYRERTDIDGLFQ